MTKRTMIVGTAGRLRGRFRLGVWLPAMLALMLLGGCQTYTTPGGPAELSIFAEPEVAEAMRPEPTATFPAGIAIARVQESGYEHAGHRAHGRGRYSVAVTSDVESDDHWERLRAMPQIRGVTRINRLVLPENLSSEQDLRTAAARFRADMVLIRTLDTNFYVEGTAEALGVLTLGLLPNKTAHVVTIASALLVDTQTGYLYGAAEATGTHDQLANAWTSSEAIDQSRRRTEVEAYGKLIDEIERMWPGVLATHAQ